MCLIGLGFAITAAAICGMALAEKDYILAGLMALFCFLSCGDVFYDPGEDE